MGTFFRIVLLLNLILTLNAVAEPLHPDLTKLRLYRTYYHLKLESPTAEQFEVWYRIMDNRNFSEWRVFHLALRNEQEAQTITPDKYLSTHWAYAGYPSPPPNQIPVPVHLKTFEDGIIASVRSNHENEGLQEVRVNYLGQYARIKVYELIRIAESQDPARQFTLSGERFYFADLEQGLLFEFGSGLSSISLLQFATEALGQQPQWLDFTLPEKIEGSALLALNSLTQELKPENLPAIYRETRDKLLQNIIATASHLEKNPNLTFPIEAALTKQTSSLLPNKLQKHINFQTLFYGRAVDFNNQLNGEVTFSIPTKMGPFHLEKNHEASQLRFIVDGTFSVANTYLKVTVMNAQGQSVEKTFTLKDTQTAAFIKDGDDIAANGMISFADDGKMMTLPGQNGYTEFNIYPGPTLIPAVLTGLDTSTAK